MRELPSIDVLRSYLRYEPDTGKLYWLKFASTRALPGWEAGHLEKNGYRRVTLARLRVPAHRIAWAMTHGRWPAAEIDHRNGNRDDNRIANLREATHSENCRNRRAIKGRKGVWPYRWGWRTAIYACGKRTYFGPFKTQAEAAEVYRAQSEKLFGEFACSSR